MKNIPKFIVLIFFVSCTSSTPYIKPKLISIDDIGFQYDESTIRIDFQESYSNDNVTLIVNGKQIFSKVLTTPDNGTGHTYSVEIKKTTSQIKIELIINEKKWKSMIKLDNGHFIGVSFDGKPKIEQAKYPIYYD